MSDLVKMTDVKIKIDTKELNIRMDQEAPKRMMEAANEVRNTILETLSGNRSGRTYFVPGTSRTYTASSPGQAPAQATSGLRQSIKAVIEGKGRSVIGKIGTSLPYGIMLEKGTRNMAPRPFLKPSLDKSISNIRSILTRKWF